MTTETEQQNLTENRDKRLLWSGAVAGFLAAAPMGVFMLAVHSLLPEWQQYTLPPESITDAIASRVGLKQEMNEQQRRIATIIAHFVYSGFAGCFYQPLTGKIPAPSALKGSIFGLLVWAIGYPVLVPLLNIPRSSSAQNQPLQRNLMMIAAHIVWGIITGEIVLLLKRSFHQN